MEIVRPVVLVTGASRGIGRAIAIAFGKKKYRVAINYYQTDDAAKALANELQDLGAESVLVKADVSNSKKVRNMLDVIEEKWGEINILINNAGITRDRSILKMSDEEWKEVMDVNLSGAFWCLRECARRMVKQKDGSIVNIASIVGARGSVGNANYAASKAGLIGLTKSAAKELGRFGVRVNAVLPGYHLTDMGQEINDEQLLSIRKSHTLDRLTDILELSEFVAFVAEQKSASGQVYNFDSRVL